MTTITKAATHTLDVRDAVLSYDVRKEDSSTAPVLLLIGSPMGAGGFVTLAGHFTDRTVVTYDPRGVERSTKADPASPSTPEEHADDLHRLIAELDAGPVDLFASSGGAVNALALVARHPEQVRTLVAHEPPLASILPDREGALAACRAVHDTYQRSGFGAGMARFIVAVGHKGPFGPDDANQPAPDPAMFGLPAEDDGTGATRSWVRTSSPARTSSPTSRRCGRPPLGSSWPPAPSRRARWRPAARSPSPSGSERRP